MEIAKIKGQDILQHFSEMVHYFIYSDSILKRVEGIIGTYEGNATEFLNKTEEKVDAEIHNIVRNISKERDDIQKIVINLPDELLCALFLRIYDVLKFFEDNKELSFTVSTTNEQFLLDCLINRWRELQHNGLSSPFLYL